MGNCTLACGPYNKVLPKKPQISLLCVIVILKATFVLLQQIYLQGSDNSVTGESGLFLTFHTTLR